MEPLIVRGMLVTRTHRAPEDATPSQAEVRAIPSASGAAAGETAQSTNNDVAESAGHLANAVLKEWAKEDK